MLNNWTQFSKLQLLLLFWGVPEDSGDQRVIKLMISSCGHFLSQFLEVYLVLLHDSGSQRANN